MFRYAALHLIDPNKANLPQTPATNDTMRTLLSILFVTLGALAVLIIMIAAFRYVFAQGDPQKTAAAKNTIIYAAIGLVISAMAFVIVSYIVKASG